MNTELVKKIKDIVGRGLEKSDLDSISINEDLIPMGLSSITFVSVVVAVEEEFQITISNENLVLSKMNTINKMASVIDFEISKKMENQTSATI